MGDKKDDFQKLSSSKDIRLWKRLWKWTAFGKKSGWDWLDLLVVSLALAVIGIWFSIAQQQREHSIQVAQQKRELTLQEQRTEDELALEEQRTDDAVQQAYLDQMSLLMLKEDLHTAEAGSEVSLLARARTLTVLSQLEANPSEDETGKEQVVEFLIEAELVHRKNGEDPVISLEETDLRGVDLDKEDLHSVNLKNAVMHGANLEGANLEDADLEDAKLVSANLRGATLNGADLKNTHFKGATMPNGQKYEDWLGTPEGLDWLRKDKKDLGAAKKREGVYEAWIKTTEGKMWLKAVGEDGKNHGPSQN